MKRLMYSLLAGAFVLASCGFVVAEKRPDVPKAAYSEKVDLSDSKGKIKGIAPMKTASSDAQLPAASAAVDEGEMKALSIAGIGADV